MIQIKGITKNFGELQVLKGIDLVINEGEVVSIVGPSGAGKTTLLQIMGTLDKADTGTVILNGTDVGVVEGELAVAENGCVWVPQTMKERAVMFISENLVIIVDRNHILDNMHEAYSQIQMSEYGYGCFISGPSKTADIAQALVMGAQAARGVTVVIK